MAPPSSESDQETAPGAYFEGYFTWSRFGPFSVAHQYLFFALYIPIGCCLLLLRTVALLLLLVVAILSSFCCEHGQRDDEDVEAGRRIRHSNRGCSVHSLVVQLSRHLFISRVQVSHDDGDSTRTRGAHQHHAPILVSNHVSEEDYVAIASQFSARVVAMDYIEKVPVIGRLMRVTDPIYIGQIGNKQSKSGGLSSPKSVEAYKAAQRDKVAAAVAASQRVAASRGDEAPSVLLFPEGVLLHGDPTRPQEAMLRYQKFIFGLGLPVQPLAIRRHVGSLQRALCPVAWDTVSASLLDNVFWFLFLPRCEYTIRVLPQMARLPDESNMDFADRVQAATADALGLVASRWGNRDKNACIREARKRRKRRQQQKKTTIEPLNMSTVQPNKPAPRPRDVELSPSNGLLSA